MMIERILEGVVMFFAAASFLGSLTVLILIFIRIRPLTSNIPILLTCNTYITVVGYSFTTVLAMGYGVYDNLHPSVSFDDYNCQLRSFVNHTFLCAFYYSCAVQAAFRLFRVVFSKHRRLQSRGVFTVAILIQWLISVLFMLVHLVLRNFEYRSDIGSCWLSYTDIRVLMAGFILMYSSPLCMMGGIYVCIIRYMRRSVQTQQIRQQANKRDLLVVRRMLILVLIAMGLAVPSLCVWVIYLITSYLTPLVYHIQLLSFSVGFLIQSLALGLMTPQIREMFRRNREVVPVATVLRTAEWRTERVHNMT